MNLVTTIGFYFCVPIIRYLVVIFIAHAFLGPLINTWAGDLLVHYGQQLMDAWRELLPW